MSLTHEQILAEVDGDVRNVDGYIDRATNSREELKAAKIQVIAAMSKVDGFISISNIQNTSQRDNPILQVIDNKLKTLDDLIANALGTKEKLLNAKEKMVNGQKQVVDGFKLLTEGRQAAQEAQTAARNSFLRDVDFYDESQSVCTDTPYFQGFDVKEMISSNTSNISLETAVRSIDSANEAANTLKRVMQCSRSNERQISPRSSIRIRNTLRKANVVSEVVAREKKARALDNPLSPRSLLKENMQTGNGEDSVNQSLKSSNHDTRFAQKKNLSGGKLEPVVLLNRAVNRKKNPKNKKVKFQLPRQIGYKCRHCHTEHGNKSALLKHIVTTHIDTKVFECFFCSYWTQNFSDLKRHIKNIHTGEKPYNCLNCESRFDQRSELKQHTTSVHQAIDGQNSN